MSFQFIIVTSFILLLGYPTKAHGQTVNLSGNQIVAEGTNVTFTCTVNGADRQLRSNWFLIFPDNRVNIRLQGGSYTPNDTNRSLFHVPDLFPGIQVEFTFVRISPAFDMVQVECFNGGARKSSFVDVIRLFTFGDNVTITEVENTTGFFSVNIIQEGDDRNLSYTWTRDGIPVTSNSRVTFQLQGINFTEGGGGMKRSDLGVYRLNISNFAGYAVTYLTLNVQYPPAIAGSEAQQPFPLQIGLPYDIITCGLNSDSGPMLDGNPFPTVTWAFNGTLITNNSAKYIINNTNLIVRDVDRDDAGLYNCTAVNVFGFDSIIYNVETYEVPSAPANVTLNTTTNTTVVITWDAPEDTDGLLVQSYIAYLFISNNDIPEEQFRTMDNSTSITITDLLPALNYTVAVAAVTQRLERLFEGNISDPITFITMSGRPILKETIMSTIDDAVIRIQWSILTNGGESIVQYLVDWIIPGSNQYVRVPRRTIDSDASYLEISLGKILAERTYRYRIQAVNSGGFISDYVFFEQLSSKGLPASPSVPSVTITTDGVLLALRTDITGIVSDNVTLVFEVEATSNSSLETIRRNCTIIDYISPHDALVRFYELEGDNYYTFRSRVFNIYGASEYSLSTTGIFISGDIVIATDENVNDDDNNNTGVIVGAVVGGTLLLILVVLVLFIVTYVLFHHRTHAASYAVNGNENESSPQNVYIEDPTNKIPEYADNPQYGSVKFGHSLPVYDAVDLPMPMKGSDANEKQPFELTISVNGKGQLHPITSTEDLVSPIHSATSSTLV